MFDFMSEANQKAQIVSGVAVHRTLVAIQTALQLPMFVCTVFRAVEDASKHAEAADGRRLLGAERPFVKMGLTDSGSL